MDKNMTLEQYQAFWYRKYFEIFGKHEADRWLKENLAHHTALKTLWIAKGIKTVGEFEEWEKTHMEEKEEFLRRAK